MCMCVCVCVCVCVCGGGGGGLKKLDTLYTLSDENQKDIITIPLRTRKALQLYRVYGINALLLCNASPEVITLKQQTNLSGGKFK